MKRLVFVLIFSLLALNFFGQGVGINNSNTPASTNAMLDVSSTSKGMFIPRMTSAQRKAIAVTANDAGLLVYDKDKSRIYMYDGAQWLPLAVDYNANMTFLGATDPQVSKNANSGYSVAVDSIYAVVGSPWDSVGYKDLQGTVQVFKKQPAGWTQIAELTASDGKAGDLFGYSVAIAGDYIVISSRDYDNIETNSGAVYVFHRSGNNWVQQFKFIDNTPTHDGHFGESVTMNDSIFAVGEPNASVGAVTYQGSVFVYHLANGTWQFEQEITANDDAYSHRFGISISINKSGTTLAIGDDLADDHFDNINMCGAVYIFTSIGNGWFQQVKLHEKYPVNMHEYGRSVNLYDKQLVVSNQFEHCEWYNKSVFTWDRATTFTHPFGTPGGFGFKVLMYDNYMFVSSLGEEINGMPNAGAVYVYKKDNNGFFKYYKRLSDPDAMAGGGFGRSLAFDGTTLIVGSPQYNSTFDWMATKGKVSFFNLSD